MTKHALLPPSSAHRWLQCPGSVPLDAREPDTSSEFADEGTCAHACAELALSQGVDCKTLIGQSVIVNGKAWEIDADMADFVQVYVDLVRSLSGELLVEQSLPIGPFTGEKDAAGTADAVVLDHEHSEIIVIDLKYGRGVKVDAENNDQLRIYALAAAAEYDFLGDFNQVRVVIVQPRLGHVSEWGIPMRDLEDFKPVVARAAERCDKAAKYFAEWNEIHEKYLNPGDKQCRWCKAKASCPALAQQVLDTVAADFVDLTEEIKPQLEESQAHAKLIDNDALGNMLAAADLVDDWLKAIRAKAKAELESGNEVPGFKLVAGRKGARAWADTTTVEETMKAMRIKHDAMYDYKLISPTTAEKLSKAGGIGPRQWPKLKEMITQPEGKPTVAPESDKRPALLINPADDFADETLESLV